MEASKKDWDRLPVFLICHKPIGFLKSLTYHDTFYLIQYLKCLFFPILLALDISVMVDLPPVSRLLFSEVKIKLYMHLFKRQ